MKKHVAVLLGGFSAERDVSLRSGAACAKALAEQGFRVTPVDVDRNVGQFSLNSSRTSPSMPCMGPMAKTGSSKAFSKCCGFPTPIPACSPRRWPCTRIARRSLWRRPAFRSPQARPCSRFEAAKAHVLPPPYVLKPLAGRLVLRRPHRQGGTLASAAGIAARGLGLWRSGAGRKITSHGRELTCAVIGDRALDVIEIKAADGGWYDYDAKYAAGGSIHELPANLKQNIYHYVQELALEGAQGARMPRRKPCRLPLRRSPRRYGRARRSGSQHAARHDRDIACARNRRLCRLTFGELVRWMVEDASCDR